MRNLDLENRIAQEKVGGVTLADLRREMVEVFSNKKYVPSIFPELSNADFQSSSMFTAILDVACFAAQCSIRKANGLEV